MSRTLRVLQLETGGGDAELIRQTLAVDELRCTILVVHGKDTFERALADESFDLIIADYNVPGYDGVAALTHAQSAQPDVPVIILSGTDFEEQAVQCLHAGATDYVSKGRLDRLVPAVQRATREAETRRARKQVEAALIHTESRKAAILDSVLDCIVTMDADGRVIDFNAAAARTFGYPKAEAIGRALADLIIPARFHARHREGLARYLATGEGPLIGRCVEIIAARSDGSEIPVELTITAIRTGSTPIFTGVLRDITERRNAEATRARLAAIVDSSDDAIVSLALDDTILTWNPGAEQLYGYAASEMIGQSRGRLVPADKRDELLPIMASATRGDAGRAFETQRIRKDGTVVDISLVISPMTDPAGRVTSVSTIARDITGRKHADAELERLGDEIWRQRLRESELAQRRTEDLEQQVRERGDAEAAVRAERDRAQRYLDTAEIILLSLDPEGRITLVNRYACTLFGWAAEELVGRHFIETCVPAAIRDETSRKLGKVLAGPDSSIVDNPIVTKSGEERLIEWRNTLLRDDQGRVVGTLSSGTDVTERTLAIEKLRQAEERMRFALRHANVGIWDMDYTSGVLRWSDAMEAQYGLEPGTFSGTFEGFVERIHPDDRASVIDTLSGAMSSGADFTVFHRAIWTDGTVRWLSGAGRVLLDERGVAVRGVGISQDITERHRLEEQFQQAQKMEAVGRLAAGVAHDFNNVLTVILGFCELLLADIDPADARKADITEIQTAGRRATGLTRQLLAFSRKEIIEPTLLDLNVIVADIRLLLERLIGEDVNVVLDVGQALAWVKADRGQVEQIILNLAVNARDAMPAGGTMTIATANVELAEDRSTVHEVRAGRHVALTVTDTGTGMTPEVQARLFEPFFTTKGVGKGTGLGLATVHGIVTRHGGSFSVDSDVGSGTRFTVYLPAAEAAERVLPAPVPASGPHVTGQTVLVVEDSDGLRYLTKRLLERQGYTVLVAANAAEARQLFDRVPSIDVLLTDVVMPGASGPELVTQLVQQRPSLKVIYMSGYTDDAIVHHGILDPGIAFVHKPFTSETLGRKLREVLESVALARDGERDGGAHRIR